MGGLSNFTLFSKTQIVSQYPILLNSWQLASMPAGGGKGEYLHQWTFYLIEKTRKALW